MLDESSQLWSLRELFTTDRVHRRRAWKEMSYQLPFRPALRHFYTLFLLGGILEGRAGRSYARMLSIYEQMITLKLRRLRSGAEPGTAYLVEGDDMVQPRDDEPEPVSESVLAKS